MTQMDLLKEVKSTIDRTTANSSDGAKPNLMLEACQRAADMVRELQKTHAAEGETLAQHLESVGKTFNELCREAARQVRELRIMPKEMAEETAKDLLKLGQEEAQRHETVSNALLTARNALLGVAQPQLPKPPQKSFITASEGADLLPRAATKPKGA